MDRVLVKSRWRRVQPVQKECGGTGDDELLLKTPANKMVNDWSADGQFLVYQEDSPQTKIDLWMMPVSGDRKPTRLLKTPFSESEATVSPDGRWMAYTSDESGVRQVYVQTFPPSETKIAGLELASRGAPAMAFGREAIVLRFRRDTGRRRCPAVPRRRIQSRRVPATVSGSHEHYSAQLRRGGPGASISGGLTLQSVAQAAPPIVVTLNWTSGLPVAR